MHQERIISEFRSEYYEEWLGSELHTVFGSDVEIDWFAESANGRDSGIVPMHVKTTSGVVRLE